MIFNDNIIMIWNISGFSFLVGKYIWAVPFKNEGGVRLEDDSQCVDKGSGQN